MRENKIAEALVSVLDESRWIGVHLAKAYLDLRNGVEEENIVRNLYENGCMTLTKARETLPEIKATGFVHLIDKRKRLGSAENPITKLFPAAITEQRFLSEIDLLRKQRRTVDYEDDRHTGHSLVDFTLTENGFALPINVKNAGTRFESAQQLVGLEPDDCVPIPAYKAYDALDKEPNLLYAISVDYDLIQTINTSLIPLFDKKEEIVWDILNKHSGLRIRDAEDKFIYGTTIKHWDRLYPKVKNSEFRLISARKATRILQKKPKRTPGIGLRAWGTGASAEVNVHISVAEETKPWSEVFDRIKSNGLVNIIEAVNRKRTEIVYDPEI